MWCPNQFLKFDNNVYYHGNFKLQGTASDMNTQLQIWNQRGRQSKKYENCVKCGVPVSFLNLILCVFSW